jgi:quercetin dioxygenase-like cupin family protein
MRVTRIHADEQGQSHFDDVAMDVSVVGAHASAPSIAASSVIAATGVMFAQLAPGWVADWHPAPRRQYWIGLRGTVEVTVSDGEVRRFGPGSVALLEDTSGTGHLTRVVDRQGAEAMFVQL